MWICLMGLWFRFLSLDYDGTELFEILGIIVAH